MFCCTAEQKNFALNPLPARNDGRSRGIRRYTVHVGRDPRKCESLGGEPRLWLTQPNLSRRLGYAYANLSACAHVLSSPVRKFFRPYAPSFGGAAMSKPTKKLTRGYNQSADTKWGSCLVCQAIDLIESGQVSRALPLLYEAARYLPDIGHRANHSEGEEERP